MMFFMLISLHVVIIIELMFKVNTQKNKGGGVGDRNKFMNKKGGKGNKGKEV